MCSESFKNIHHEYSSSWIEDRLFAVPVFKHTTPVKEKYREAGQEPFSEIFNQNQRWQQ